MRVKRKRRYLGIFSIYTAVNLMLLYKIRGSDEVRDNWQQVYMKAFHWWDLLLLLILLCCVYALMNVFTVVCVPKVRQWYAAHGRSKALVRELNFGQIFGMILIIWFFFFLVFYPGTAMNDTIFILENPWERSEQHPILYNLYTYGLFSLGVKLHNPNLGLALISLIQMITMDCVLAKAIILLHRKGVAAWLCRLMALYFGLAPFFSTYAFSAIKDTPFSIFMFAMLLQLYELADSKGEVLGKPAFWLRMAISMFGVMGFRNNGVLIVLGIGILLLLLYRKYSRQLALLCVGVVLIGRLVSCLLTPADVEPLFQEKAGIAIQQVGAAVEK